MKKNIIILSALLQLAAGCVKRSFLEAEPSSNLFTIRSLSDCQRLLNNEITFTEIPISGEISADNFLLSPDSWSSLSDQDHDLYLWARHLWAGQTNILDYNVPYTQVNICNEVLAALNRITITAQEKKEKQHIEGTALFRRAFAFHNLLQLFTRPYASSTAQRDTGIALPLMPDYNAVFYRASMKESYDQVIKDLTNAITLLPDNIDTANKYNPTRPAAEGLLARVYLSMGEYNMAEQWASSCLDHHGVLLDYNSLNLSRPAFPKYNEEILYYSWLMSDNHFFRYNKQGKECYIDPELYDLYSEDDLRKLIFYHTNGTTPPILHLSYSGGITAFGGIATDEIYLIRAECRVRQENLGGAADDLNALLMKRYRTNTFSPYIPARITLQLILEERRKELAFRGLRWSDLRRLNKEGAAITLKRHVNGNVYVLPPGDLRYTLPIPDDAIAGSHIVQNPR